MTTFKKKFLKWPFWIFKFSPKMLKHKNFAISLTVRDGAISSKFSTPRVCKKYRTTFQKKILKWRPFWIFKFSPKMQSHKIFAIFLTVQDRAISSKFFTPRVFKKSDNFLKTFQKWRPFQIFVQNAKTQNYCYLFNP